MGALINGPIGACGIGTVVVLGQGPQRQVMVLLSPDLIVKGAGVRVHLDDPVQGVFRLIENIRHCVASGGAIGNFIVSEDPRVIPVSVQKHPAAPSGRDHELDVIP
jgi:hypothetical protein